MLTKTARDGTPQAELTTYVYDEAVAGFHNVGLLTRAENPSGILRYRYDQVGREAQRIYTIDGSDYTLASGFDIAGRLIWQDYPDGDTVGSALDPVTYDAAGRLDAVPGLVTSATYDASGNADVFTRANGVVSTYGYSLTRGWLDSVVTTSGATSIQNMSYGRDDAGQITAVTSTFTDESWTYGYDALRRLLTATNTDNAAHSRSYTYDSIGNMLTNSGVTGTYSYPAAGSARPHAVTSVGSWTYTYDANGNMTSGAGRSYTYSGENRPTQIDTQAYTYGPDGERWKTVDSAPGGGTTLYLGGSIEIAAGVMTKYLPGSAKRVGSPGAPLVETFWLHHDHQGSIQAITDAAGTQIQRFTYYPYGDRIATVSAHTETKGWIGERQDATGLFYLHARYYDPVIGRFVSADPSDPLAPGVGLNRFSYAWNNPIRFVDPSGLALTVGTSHKDGIYNDRTGAIEYPYGGDKDWRRREEIYSLRDETESARIRYYDAAVPVPSPKAGNIILGIVADFIVPGMGLYDGIRNIRNGNYLAGTFDILTELPGLKQVDAVLGAVAGARKLGRIGNGPENVPYFRVQGGGSGNATSRDALRVNPDGRVSISPGCTGSICVSVEGPEHAAYYVTNKRPDGSVVVFEVDRATHNQIMENLVPQQGNSGAGVKLVDPTTPGISIELDQVFSELMTSGSSNGRVLSRQEFLDEFTGN